MPCDVSPELVLRQQMQNACRAASRTEKNPPLSGPCSIPLADRRQVRESCARPSASGLLLLLHRVALCVVSVRRPLVALCCAKPNAALPAAHFRLRCSDPASADKARSRTPPRHHLLSLQILGPRSIPVKNRLRLAVGATSQARRSDIFRTLRKWRLERVSVLRFRPEFWRVPNLPRPRTQ